MIESIKKTIYAGLGATMVTKDKVEQTLSDFVKKGKISADEASELAEKIVTESRKEFAETKDDLTKTIEDWFDESKWVTQKQLRSLEDRVSQLESVSKDGPH